MRTTEPVDFVQMYLDCHAYALHLPDADYPECGPDNLVRIAEQYGILIEYLEDDDPRNPCSGWAWWYRVQGPKEHVIRFLAAECYGSEEEAREAICGANPTCAAGPVEMWDRDPDSA